MSAEQATRTVIVKADCATAFRLWTEFERFPEFMKHIKSVQKTGPDSSHWEAQGPLGKTVQWDARTTRMEQNKRIAWNSFQGDIKTTGQVTFNELPNDETEITAVFSYDAPSLGKAFTGSLDDMLEEDLRNFKHYCEQQAGIMTGARST